MIRDGRMPSLVVFRRSVTSSHDEVYTSGSKIGQHVFTLTVSWAFMLFVLLYFPCIVTIATFRREVGCKWAAFTVVNSLVLAWVVAFGVYQIFG